MRRLVLAAGDRASGVQDVAKWRDVIAVVAGNYHSVAVVDSGRVLAAGDNDDEHCDSAGWHLADSDTHQCFDNL